MYKQSDSRPTFNLGELMVLLEAALLIHIDIDGTAGHTVVIEGSAHHQVISPDNEKEMMNS